jgi:tetratricopeptide (TPR) repeat protein
VTTQAAWRQAQALVYASRGEHAEAERLAREAVAIFETTDSFWWQGEALCVLADVLLAAGRHDDAAAALREALDRFERKQIVPLVRRTRERIAALRGMRA